MAKEVLSVRISVEAKSRLMELSQDQGLKPAEVLEGLILGTGAPRRVYREVPGVEVSSEEAKRRGLIKVAGGGYADSAKIAEMQKKLGQT